MTTPLPALPDLIERDPAVILADTLDQLSTALGRDLQPAQVETLVAHVWAYIETLVRIAFQDAAQQSYVAFARSPGLDFLGENIGVVRLVATPATTTLRFTLAAPLGGDLLIPAGTRVQTTDGVIVFATSSDLTIAAGNTSGDVASASTTPGVLGNSYSANDVRVLLDPIAGVATVANLASPSGGSEAEPDDVLRERIKAAPNQFSVAGSAAAYRFHALSVSPTVSDVTVVSPAPGRVSVYVLAVDGIPSVELLGAVAAVLTSQKVRPLTDIVEVKAPTEVGYVIAATVQLYPGVDVPSTMAAVGAAANAYAADRAAGLGRDLVPSQVIAALSLPGLVYQVTLTAPVLTVVAGSEWAHCGSVSITNGTVGGP